MFEQFTFNVLKVNFSNDSDACNDISCIVYLSNNIAYLTKCFYIFITTSTVIWIDILFL